MLYIHGNCAYIMLVFGKHVYELHLPLISGELGSSPLTSLYMFRACCMSGNWGYFWYSFPYALRSRSQFFTVPSMQLTMFFTSLKQNWHLLCWIKMGGGLCGCLSGCLMGWLNGWVWFEALQTRIICVCVCVCVSDGQWRWQSKRKIKMQQTLKFT